MKNNSILAALSILLLFASCGRDRADRLPVVPAEGQSSTVALAKVNLDGHEGFDALDRFLAASASPADILRVYEDLARIAAGSRMVLFRAGVAAASLVGEEKGLPVARGILKALERDNPMDCNVRFLEAEIARARLAAPDGTLRVRNQNVDAAQIFIRALTQLQGTCPDWVGPHGTSIPVIQTSIDMVVVSARELDPEALDRPLPAEGAPPIEPLQGSGETGAATSPPPPVEPPPQDAAALP